MKSSLIKLVLIVCLFGLPVFPPAFSADDDEGLDSLNFVSTNESSEKEGSGAVQEKSLADTMELDYDPKKDSSNEGGGKSDKGSDGPGGKQDGKDEGAQPKESPADEGLGLDGPTPEKVKADDLPVGTPIADPMKYYLVHIKSSIAMDVNAVYRTYSVFQDSDEDVEAEVAIKGDEKRNAYTGRGVLRYVDAHLEAVLAGGGGRVTASGKLAKKPREEQYIFVVAQKDLSDNMKFSSVVFWSQDKKIYEFEVNGQPVGPGSGIGISDAVKDVPLNGDWKKAEPISEKGFPNVNIQGRSMVRVERLERLSKEAQERDNLPNYMVPDIPKMTPQQKGELDRGIDEALAAVREDVPEPPQPGDGKEAWDSYHDRVQAREELLQGLAYTKRRMNQKFTEKS